MTEDQVTYKRINVRDYGFHPLSLRLWHGMALDAWLRVMRGKWHLVSPRRYPLAATITVFSVFNLALKGITRLIYGRRVDQTVIEPDPIFVIGYWRSGTTWLHNLFMLDPRFAAPTQGACFTPEFFLTTQKALSPILQRLSPETRPMDNVKLDLSAAEEDEMGLCISGALSPYASLLFPSEEPISIYKPEDMSQQDAENWRRKWLRFLRSVQFVNPGKQLVLKSPTHSLRIKEVLHHFPNAKFVHIRRDPYSIFLSRRHASEAMHSVSALQEFIPVKPDRDERAMSDFVGFHEKLEADIKKIPPDQFTTVRYEDLRADMLSGMRKIYEDLQLGGFSELEPTLKDLMTTARPYKNNEFELDEATLRMMDKQFAEVFALYGYLPMNQKSSPIEMTSAGKVTEAIFRYRIMALILFLALVTFLAAGVFRLELSSNSRTFLGENTQEYLDILHLDETYTQSNTVLIMVVPPVGTAFDPDTLRVLQTMTDDMWQVPYALRADSAVNHMHSYADGDDVFVEPLLDEFAEVTPEAAERFRELALASENLRNTLLSEDGHAYGIAVKFILPDDQPNARFEVQTYLEELWTSWETSNPGWGIHATGGLLGNSLLAQVAFEDITVLVPLAFFGAVVLFAFALGSVFAVGALLLVLGSATLATYGFAGWTNVALTAGTAISPMAVLVLVSTSCIHIMISAVRASEKGQVAHPMKYAIESNLAPVTVSHLTTAFGFLCLNFASSEPLANMGNIVAFGLLVGHFAVFAVLPALLVNRAPTRAGPLMASRESMRRLAKWIIGNSRVWIVLFSIAGILAVIGISRIGYDDHVIRYFDTRYELRQDSDAIQEQLTGLDSLVFSFQADAGTSVFDPEFLRSVDRFVTWLEQQPHVISVGSLSEIIKDLNRSMSGDDPSAYRIGDTQPANAQLLLLYELSLPLGMDLNTIMDVDRTSTLVSATIRAPHSDITRNLAETADAWLVENEPGFATRASGLAIAFARISERNNSQMLFGFLTALFLISITLTITLRSVRFGVISLVPNLAPALLAFGLWGFIVRDVNLGSTVVTTMTFGIVVDDTVHFLMQHLRNRRLGLSTQKALEETFTVVGSSITLTSFSILIGFGIMSISGFSINQHIGMLTSVVIVFALLCDLLLLPAIIKLTQDKEK